MKHKKVLIALPNDTLGGAEQYLKLIAIYFLKNGFQVYVFFCKKRNTGAWEDLLQDANCSIFYTNSSTEKTGIFMMLQNILRVRNNTYEYTFSSHVHINGFLGILRTLGIVKTQYFIGRESTSIFIRFKGLKLKMFKALYYFGYSTIDLIICQSELMKAQLIQGMGRFFTDRKIEVIGNPIDLEASKIQSPITPAELDGLKYIVSAGRLIREKGFDVLISAFCEILLQWPEYKLIILGDGKEKLALEGLINKLGLTGNVILPGFVSNVYPYFKNAQLCVVSSRIEGFPNVLLQMMSQNDKVVSTLCAGGISDIKGVFLADTDNKSSLFDAMNVALMSNTTPNRDVFDRELEIRSVEKFVEKIDLYLNK